MRNITFKKSLNAKQLRLFWIGCCFWVIMGFSLLVYLYNVQVTNDRTETAYKGEGIVSSIQMELSRCYETTKLMIDLYTVNHTEFLKLFEQICQELQTDNLAIGSMYWAPKGVIEYSYPDKVDESTRNFEMLKDPVQGPKAQYAVETHQPTIAGPHNLIEGGTGFILRTPYFNEEGEFEAFAIMVIDTELFLAQVKANLAEELQNYRFAVSKKEDPTAVYEEQGYIFYNDGPINERIVTLPFKAPNDEWYLTLEPEDGWTPIHNMRSSIVIVLLLLFIILVAFYYILLNRQMEQEIDKAKKEQERMREIEQFQVQLMEARDAAEAANAAKTSFLFNMSHDIRTPMNAILGFRDLLEKHQEEPEKRKDYLRKIGESSTILLSIINNVLEMSRIEKGAIELNETAWSADQFTDSLFSIFKDMMQQKGITFTKQIEVNQHYIYCDPIKLREVCHNIISNAWKYTNPGGRVDVMIKELPYDREGFVLYQTKVSDTGIGMSKEFLPHLFEEFSRENNSSGNKIEGTGLGMSIVKRLVELMDGTIEVESQKGVGTTFTFTIPHRIANKADMVNHAGIELDPKLFAGKRILLAEDNDLNAEIAQEILSDYGFLIDRAVDGQEAVEKIESAADNYYNVILMDIQMPRMNGYEATRTIRAMHNSAKSTIPIIAMTANAFEEDRKEAFRSGMNDHVAKPIDLHELIKALSNII